MRNMLYNKLVVQLQPSSRDHRVFIGWLTKRMQPELGAFIRNKMGMSPSTFKSKEDKVIAIYERYKDKRPEVYNYIKGADAPAPADKDKTEEVRVNLDEAQKEMENRLDEVVSERAEAFVQATDQYVKEAIDRESKVLNQVEVVVKKSGTKTRKLKDVILPSYFQHLVNLTSSRVNIMLVGPTGCGKTHIVGLLAQTLSMRYSSISCSVGMTESKLEGWLLPTGTGGKFEYLTSQFVDMYENGGIFLLDEIDASDANTLVFINQAIAQDHFFLPKRFKKPLVKKHKDFVIVAAANTFGHGADMMFVGRNQLDAATLDRFRAGMVTVDYDERVEKELIDPEVYTWGLHIRNRINQHKVRRAMSTRTMIEFSKLKADHQYGKEEWEQSYYADWTSDEKLRVTS